MKARYAEKIGIYFVSVSHRDLSEICVLCGYFIRAGKWYVRADKGIAHYSCAKRAKWKKNKRKSEKLLRVEKIQREPQLMRVRVIKRADR
jgi:hypothetical protein